MKRDPLMLNGACGKCGTPYSVQVPGMEGALDLPPPGASIERSFSYWCEKCGAKLDFEVSLKNVNGEYELALITGHPDAPSDP
jgi:hypothetical protein